MPNVLITGASRGIGRATALRLADAGWSVIGGVRNEADGEALAAERPGQITPVILDVTDADYVAGLTAQLPPTLDAVVNNAGVMLAGPIEGLPLDELRRVFEINVFGQVAVAQAVLPRLRASRGRIVFISSVSGRISTPMSGAYNGSKFALEGIADALRTELRPWGVRVSLIEPAQTSTDIWHRAAEAFDADLATLTPEHRELYARHAKGFKRVIPISQKLAAPADSVARSVEQALTVRRPRARYVVGAGPKLQTALMQVTPAAIGDPILSRLVGVPRRA